MAEENTTEPDKPDVSQDDAQTNPEDHKEQSPWEKAGEQFDPEKAWNLVQHLREENKGLKERNRAYEDERLSDKEKAERDLAEAREQLERVKAERTLAQIRAKYPQLTDGDMDFLGSGTPEELNARAAKLAARFDAAKASAGPEGNINPLRRRPSGGTDPTKPRHTDWIRDALAKH
ncbi:hypothetical protein [Bifidobacterium sp. AGR2158]|uniref:hypothetical protein n=1 Tax=Bifidobacterium sp. AGR2158 TaxID=1280675 RepID=UPI00040D9069|nr:hypothetical protein [Bifidobacterium sp. AGR2158]